jgi:hypothetical protein
MDAWSLRIFASLGIPGIVIGVFYLLLRRFNFQFATIGPAESAAIVVLFLLIVAGVTVFALWHVLPSKPSAAKVGELRPDRTQDDSSPSSAPPNEMSPVFRQLYENPRGTPRVPFAVFEGKYRPRMYTRGTRGSMIFGCAFMLFWCLTLFWGAGSSIGALQPEGIFDTLSILPFLLVPVLMVYFGVVMLLNQIMLLMGKVRVYAGADMVLISRSLGDFFSSHTVILAEEWRFDGTVFVSRQKGTKVPLPDLPEHPRTELINVLRSGWR